MLGLMIAVSAVRDGRTIGDAQNVDSQMAGAVHKDRTGV